MAVITVSRKLGSEGDGMVDILCNQLGVCRVDKAMLVQIAKGVGVDAAMLQSGMALLAPGSILLALGIALLTDVLFGLYAPLRAARLEPIEALRHEWGVFH